MSDNKYPAIFQPECDSEIKVLVYGECNGFNAIHLDGPHKGTKTNYFVDDELKNITREYLTNTYGKCESQEHADYICKIAENAGFWVINDYSDVWSWFCFDGVHLEFYTEKVASNDGEKLIHLPLPPKENEMESQLPTATSETEMPKAKPDKPIYTKEMHERGELPPVGSGVQLSFGRGVVKLDKDDNGFLCVLVNGKYYLTNKESIKPIQTIEDEMNKILSNHYDNGGMDEDLIKKFLEKYNITPKGE